MKKLLTFILILCLVVAMSTPVSADYYWEKDVSADDFANALVDYCNGNEVHNMTKYELNISNHACKVCNVRTGKSLDFRIMCKDSYYVIIPIFIPFIPFPLPQVYEFYGTVHVDNPKDGLKKPYTLTITHDDTKFTAVGKNWRLEVRDTGNTRFKV